MNYKNVKIIICYLMIGISSYASTTDTYLPTTTNEVPQSRAAKRRLRREQNNTLSSQNLPIAAPTTQESRAERRRNRRKKFGQIEHAHHVPAAGSVPLSEFAAHNRNNLPIETIPESNSTDDSIGGPDATGSLPLATDDSFGTSSIEHDLEKIEVPPMDDGSPDDLIEFQFQDADLSNLLLQVEAIFNCSFITDEAVDSNKSKTIKGNKITYRTTHPITKKEAWALFLTFLDIAGFNIVPQADPSVFRIQPFESARKAPLPTFIDTDFMQLPENDAMIRYLYFIKNSTLESLQPIIESLSSTISKIIFLKESKAFILIDKGFNIKMLMRIISQFDQACSPQSWSFLRLKYSDAEYVSKLYESLAPAAENRPPTPLFGARRPPTTTYFSDNTRIVAEPRTNSLILLGTPEAIKKLERFIIKHIDINPEQLHSPLNVYKLKYADAETIVSIMNTISAFGKNSPADGMRVEQRYSKPVTFIAEKTTNCVVIKGDYDSYLMAKSIIDQLDSAQPQIAIDIMVISVSHDENKQLGAQLRSKANLDCNSGNNVKFQTSGLNGLGIVQNNTADLGVNRLLGNLLNLVTQSTPGSTVITLGKDIFGVWGIFQALQTVSNSEVISNPFLITTNRKTASVSVGETRRVISSQIIQNQNTPTNTEQNLAANFTIEVNPQINADGMVVLKIDITFNQFTNPPSSTDISSGNQITRSIKTIATIADQEVLALGGFIRDRTTQGASKVPILGDIPLAGWLFKNEQKEDIKDNLLILISSRIIEPEEIEDIKQFTDERIAAYQSALTEMDAQSSLRDPIQNNFFNKDSLQKESDRFIFERNKSSRYKKITPATKLTNNATPTIAAPAAPTVHQQASLKQSRPQFSLTGNLKAPITDKKEIAC